MTCVEALLIRITLEVCLHSKKSRTVLCNIGNELENIHVFVSTLMICCHEKTEVDYV